MSDTDPNSTPPPAPPADPPPDPTPPPTPPPVKSDDGMAELKETVNGLVSAVAEMGTAVAALAGSQKKPDTVPVRKPWTHIGSKPKETQP